MQGREGGQREREREPDRDSGKGDNLQKTTLDILYLDRELPQLPARDTTTTPPRMAGSSVNAGGSVAFALQDETPAIPQSSPKRARETTGTDEGDSGDQPLTLALLQQALQVNQQQITSSLHESLEGLGRRVGNLEQNMDQHVENTTKLLGAMTDRHCDIENTVKKVSDSYDDVRRRLELLEGKFATASFSNTTTSTRTTEPGGLENNKPALIMGGWDADQSASETLRLVKQHVEELEIDIDMTDSFVPGLRRGFAIVPIAPRVGEDQSTFRGRIRDSLRHIREAKVITGQKPQGGDRHFWAAISETPERRKRAQFAGKIKRLILESEGDKHKLDVEFGTGNVWYNSVKIASATTTPPAGADTVGIGWISLPTLARQIGVALGSLTDTWDELKKPLV